LGIDKQSVHKPIRKTTVVFFATAAAALWFSSAHAGSTDPLIEGAKLCTKQLPQYEKQHGIPAHLLSAIASTESGRYHNDLKIRIPWPWTINAEGRGYYFDNKAEAIAAVRKLQAQGVQSIDVGCMQVNLHHHPDAFTSLDEAFDPPHNIAYAAVFLRQLYEETGSWKEAAADYHSKTPAKGTSYVGRVYDSWQRLVEKLRLAKLQVPASSIVAMRDMRPGTSSYASKTGVVYASNLPKPTVQKIAALPEQEGRKIATYQPVRMNTVKLSKKDPPHNSDMMVVRPEIQTAAARVALPSTGVLRFDTPSLNDRKTGPNFIFND